MSPVKKRKNEGKKLKKQKTKKFEISQKERKRGLKGIPSETAQKMFFLFFEETLQEIVLQARLNKLKIKKGRTKP